MISLMLMQIEIRSQNDLDTYTAEVLLRHALRPLFVVTGRTYKRMRHSEESLH